MFPCDCSIELSVLVKGEELLELSMDGLPRGLVRQFLVTPNFISDVCRNKAAGA